MLRKNRAKGRPAPHPEDFPLGSPESRAAARSLAEQPARRTWSSADRGIRIVSLIPGLAAQEGVFIQPDGTTISIIIESAADRDTPANRLERSASPQPFEKPQQSEQKGEKT